MKSNYAKYIEERENIHIIEDNTGFITYLFLEDHVFIEDLFVVPEFRKRNIGTNFFNQVVLKAKELGYKKAMCSVDPKTNNSTNSLKAILAVGFKLCIIADDMIYLTKEI